MTSYLAGFGALLLLAFVFLWIPGREWIRTAVAMFVLAVLASLAYIELGAWRELRINELQLLTMTSDEGTQEQREELLELLNTASVRDSRYAYLLGHRLLLDKDFTEARDQFASLRAQGTDDFNVNLSFVQSDFLARKGLLGEDARDLAWELLESNNPVLLEILVLDSLRQGDQDAFLEVWPKYSATPRGLALAESLGQPQADAELQFISEGRMDVSAGIRVELSASPGLEVPLDTVVFVIARDVSASGPPLAVRRLRFSDLPATVTLSDADAMIESRKLSDSAEIEVVARIAISGGPIAAEGDVEASSGVIRLDSELTSVKLRLAR